MDCFCFTLFYSASLSINRLWIIFFKSCHFISLVRRSLLSVYPVFCHVRSFCFALKLSSALTVLKRTGFSKSFHDERVLLCNPCHNFETSNTKCHDSPDIITATLIPLQIRFSLQKERKNINISAGENKNKSASSFTSYRHFNGSFSSLLSFILWLTQSIKVMWTDTAIIRLCRMCFIVSFSHQFFKSFQIRRDVAKDTTNVSNLIANKLFIFSIIINYQLNDLKWNFNQLFIFCLISWFL